MRPGNRDSSFFLIDVDTLENEDGIAYMEDLLVQHMVKTKIKYRTVNGYHYVTTPFNPEIFSNHGIYDCMPCEIKKDALILLSPFHEG